MEYGYEYTTTDGGKHFFVEGCTCCEMSTGGLHESNCPYKKDEEDYNQVIPLAEALKEEKDGSKREANLQRG